MQTTVCVRLILWHLSVLILGQWVIIPVVDVWRCSVCVCELILGQWVIIPGLDVWRWSLGMLEWLVVAAVVWHLVDAMPPSGQAGCCGRHSPHLDQRPQLHRHHINLRNYTHIRSTSTTTHTQINVRNYTHIRSTSATTDITSTYATTHTQINLRNYAHITSTSTTTHTSDQSPQLHTCSWWVTTYVGKPSAVSQPTRPTQPFILSGSINE